MAETQAPLMGGDDVTTPVGAPVPPRFRLRIPRRWALIAAGAVLAVLVVLPVFSTLQPGYYERYPSLRGRMGNWRVSTHARMSCSDCHVDPGAGGFITFAARSIPAFYSQLAFGPRATNLLSAPSSAACQKCHTTYRRISPDGDLLIPHRAHVDVLEIRCAVCHKDLVHSESPKGFNRPVMSTCLKCHDGKQAANECIKCHTRKEVPDNHKQGDWLDVHAAKADTIDCGECHGWSPDYCSTTCHTQRPASHAGNFKHTHQSRVAARGANGCYVCHDEKTFCGECH